MGGRGMGTRRSRDGLRRGPMQRGGLHAVLALITVVVACAAGAHPGVAANDVVVYRDHYGVPHIEAHDLQGLAYATGYVTARDRLFELDVIRKLGQGRLSELIGPSMLPMDRYVRREYLLANDIEAQFQALSPLQRSLFVAYADGVNRGAAETLATATPSLMVALGDVWEPWKPEDSVVVDMVFTMVAFGGEGAGGELDNLALLQDLRHRFGDVKGWLLFNAIVPPTYTDAPTIIPPGEGPPPPPPQTGYQVDGPSAGQQALFQLPGFTAAAQALSSELATVRHLAASLPVPRIGSFGAAVSGRRTASGGGLLLGSPQAGMTAPPVFYEVGWHIPGHLDCEGFTVPGLGPAIGIGWCNQHAWTLIAGNLGDQADLYVERLDPNDPHRYFYQGEWRHTVQKTTTYVVRSTVGCPGPGGLVGPCAPQLVTETYDYTVHGAIGVVDSAAHLGLAYRRAQTNVFLRSVLGALGWNLSRDLDGFMAGTDAFTATYNLLYADAAGHIAYRFTGLQPVRPGTDRRFPVPGTGEAEWQGFLNACQMPTDVDPRTGFFAVNQGIESKSIWWWPDSSLVGVGKVSRVALDQQLLDTLHQAHLGDLAALDRPYIESVEPYEALFYPIVHHALAGATDPRLQLASSLLDQWKAQGFARTDADGDGLEDHPALAVFELDPLDYSGNGSDGFPAPLGQALIHAVLDPLTGGRLVGYYYQQLSDVYEAFTSGPLHQVVGDVDALVRRAVAGVVDELVRQHGPDPRAWRRPFPREGFTALEPVAPPPMVGMDHGSYSQVVDTGAAVGENVEPPGNVAADSAADVALIEAGRPPAHWADQRGLYQAYDFKPMLMRPDQYRANPEAVIALDTGGRYGSDTAIDTSVARDPCRTARVGAAGGTPTSSAMAALASLPATAAPLPTAVALAVPALLAASLVGRRRRSGPTPTSRILSAR